MSDPGVPEPTHSAPGGDDPALLARAKELFLSIVETDPGQWDRSVDDACAGDRALSDLVRMLLGGERATLNAEKIGRQIRGAHDELVSRAADESVGATIGAYQLVERIGEGGFGAVFLARQERPVRRTVALKIIKLGMDTRQVVARFEAERQALAMMDHPNIAKVFDAGVSASGRPYFVMELVTGASITDYCDEHRLSVRDRLGLIATVCDALHHAHQKGVIHRDIKPSNVLISTAGEQPQPKIIDFGIAKATGAGPTEQTVLTIQQQMIGTPEYMSPEQAGESAEGIDTRTDVYSVGVLLYELLVGVTPFDSKRLRSASLSEVQRIIRAEEPPKASTRLRTSSQTLMNIAGLRGTAPAKLASALRGELDWIVLKAMEKDRGRRYDSAAAMAVDIRRYLSGYAVLAAPPSTLYRMRTIVRRNKGAALAGVLLVLSLVGGLVGTSAGLLNAEKQRKAAVSERSRADQNAAEARAAESLATRQAYSASMMSASAAVNAAQFASARAFLDAASPGLRGWEWRVLDSALDRSFRTVAATLSRTDSVVTQLEATPDGKSFFTANANSDGQVDRWDLASGRLLQSFPSPVPSGAADRSVAFIGIAGDQLTIAPRYVKQGSPTFEVETWDLSSGQRVARNQISNPDNLMLEPFVSPDGSRVTLYSAGRIRSTSTATDHVLAEVEVGSLRRIPLHYSMDGKLLADAASRSPYDVTVRDARTLAALHKVGADRLVRIVRFSNDDRWLGVVSSGDAVQIWDLAASPPTATVLPHPTEACQIRFSFDGTLVATNAIDHTIRVWDRATGRLLGTYASQRLDPFGLMFLPDGKTVAGWEFGGPVRFWDITSEQTAVLRGHKSIVSKAQFVPNNPAGLIISSSWEGADGSTGIVRLWDAESGEEVGVHRGRLGDIAYCLTVSDEGRIAAIGVWNQVGENARLAGFQNVNFDRLELLDLTTGELLSTTPLVRRTTWMGFAEDSRTLIFADTSRDRSDGWRSQLHAIEARSGVVLRTRDLDVASDWAFARSRDGRVIAAASLSDRERAAKSEQAHTMLLLDSQTLQTLRQFDELPDGQQSIALSWDGSRLATGGRDGIVRVYDAQTGVRLAEMHGDRMNVLTLAFNPDGSRLASAGLDRKITIWNAATFDPVAALGGHEGHIGDICWDQAGQRLVSASGDFTVRVWDPQPIRTRVQAREDRQAALARMEPLVARLFDELKTPAKVVARITDDPSLPALDRKTALQLVLRTSLDAAAKPAE